jgi:cellulose biosynthesis protein BcsQ
MPSRPRERTRLVLITGPRGGVGRTLLAVGLAGRLAARSSVVVLDATGSGSAGWWLGLSPGPWSDLESLAEELTAEHLDIVAAQRERLRLVGGVSAMPSVGLVMAAARAATAIAEIVIVDAPPIFDERTRALETIADRVLLVAGDDPTSVAAIAAAADEQRVWLIASRCAATSLAGRSVMRHLPDDGGSVRCAAGGPSAVGGALGRAYDDLSELLAIDIA